MLTVPKTFFSASFSCPYKLGNTWLPSNTFYDLIREHVHFCTKAWFPFRLCVFRCSSWLFLARFGFSSSDVHCCFLLLFVAFCCFSLLFVARRSFLLFIALDINHLPLVQKWCECMKMDMKNALCCFLLLVLVFGACFHLPFVAFCCSSLLFLVFEIESILPQNQNRQMHFVARYCFLLLVLDFCGCFHLSIALLVVAFCWYEKPRRATKGKKCPNGNQA